MIASNMEVIANELWNELYIFVASATRALKNLLRQCRRSPWFPLLAVAGGALLAVIAIKLLAMFATAFDISFLRDVGGNAGPGAAAGAAGAGAAAYSGGHPGMPAPNAFPGPIGPPAWAAPAGGPPDPPSPWWPPQYGPPSPFPSPWKGPFAGPPNPDGSPPGRPRQGESVSAGPMIWFSQGVQRAAEAIMGKDGVGSSGNACGKA